MNDNTVAVRTRNLCQNKEKKKKTIAEVMKQVIRNRDKKKITLIVTHEEGASMGRDLD